jgi:hypothetical protein
MLKFLRKANVSGVADRHRERFLKHIKDHGGDGAESILGRRVAITSERDRMLGSIVIGEDGLE